MAEEGGNAPVNDHSEGQTLDDAAKFLHGPIAGVTAVALLVAAFFFSRLSGGESWGWKTASDIAVNLGTVTMALWIAANVAHRLGGGPSEVLARLQERRLREAIEAATQDLLRRDPIVFQIEQRYLDVNWRELFHTCTNLTIVGMFYAGWLRDREVFSGIESVLKTGGSLELFLLHPEADKAIEVTLQERRSDGGLDGERDVIERIIGSMATAQYIKERAGGKRAGAISALLISRKPNFRLVLIRRSLPPQELVLIAPYEHIYNSNEVRAPALILDLAEGSDVRRWVYDELAAFRGGVTALTLEEGLETARGPASRVGLDLDAEVEKGRNIN